MAERQSNNNNKLDDEVNADDENLSIQIHIQMKTDKQKESQSTTTINKTEISNTKQTYMERGIIRNTNFVDRAPNIYPQSIESWHPTYPEHPVTPNTQRRSLDETSRRYPLQHRDSLTMSGEFARGHRRGRSDESYRRSSVRSPIEAWDPSVTQHVVSPSRQKISFDENSNSYSSNHRISPTISVQFVKGHRRGRSDESYRLGSYFPSVEAWNSIHTEGLVTPNSQQTLLDETSNRYQLQRMNSPSMSVQFERGHRRGRSDEAYQVGSFPPSLAAWNPIHTEQSATNNSPKRSVDETSSGYLLGHGNSLPIMSGQFVRGHRRGRSDEVYREGSFPPVGSPLQFSYNIHQSPVQFSPNIHQSPPQFSPNIDQSRPLHISRSDNYLLHSQSSIDHIDDLSYRYVHPYFQSVSVDNVTKQYVSDTIQRQNVAFIELSTSIRMSERKLRELEEEVGKCEKKLNQILSIQKNPTEKEYRQLKDEISILHTELTVMFNDCDKLGIPTDSPKPPRPPPPTPSPTKITAEQEAEERWSCPSCTFSNLLVGECEACLKPRPSQNMQRHL